MCWCGGSFERLNKYPPADVSGDLPGRKNAFLGSESSFSHISAITSLPFGTPDSASARSSAANFGRLPNDSVLIVSPFVPECP
jgi:hypothetical protein